MKVFCLLGLALQAVVPQDYKALYKSIKEFIRLHPDQIPPLVRLSFHDLMNFDPSTGIGGPLGCIRQEPQRSMAQNNHLQLPTDMLFTHVQNLRGNYSAGDVISMAGKVAIEESYCVVVKWRPGRPNCPGPEPELGPMGTISSMAELQPFLDRYGFTAREMALLIAGAHGLKGARARLSTPEPMFMSTINSGAKWVKDTISILWAYFGSREDPAFKGAGLVRLPIDMLFFPRSIQETIVVGNIGRPNVDPSATVVEEYIVPFAYVNDKVFNDEFAKVYAKMLEIGTSSLGDYFVDEPLSC